MQRADGAAVDRLLAEIDAAIRRHAWHLAPSWGVLGVDDLAQEGRIAAAEAAHSHDASTNVPVRAWMVIRARYAMVDTIRAVFGRHGQRASLNQAHSINEDDDNGRQSHEPTCPPDHAAFELADAVANLTATEQQIVSMRLRGMTLLQVGEALGLSESTICVKLKKIYPRLNPTGTPNE